MKGFVSLADCLLNNSYNFKEFVSNDVLTFSTFWGLALVESGSSLSKKGFLRTYAVMGRSNIT